MQLLLKLAGTETAVLDFWLGNFGWANVAVPVYIRVLQSLFRVCRVFWSLKPALRAFQVAVVRPPFRTATCEYAFRLYNVRTHAFEDVVVDDFVPCKDGVPVHVKANGVTKDRAGDPF